jgi:hypothetical protein
MAHGDSSELKDINGRLDMLFDQIHALREGLTHPASTSDADSEVLMKSLKQEVHLLREELTGLREMLEGVTSALSGAQKAYAAVAQRADLLEKRMEIMLIQQRQGLKKKEA